MRNGSSSICCSSSPVAMGLPQVLGSQAPHHGWWYRQLNASAREVTMEAEEMVRMPLLNGLVSLNVLLLVAYLLLFLLAKLFHRLCRARDHGRDSRTEIAGRSDNTVLAAAAAADVAAGERQADTMFWFDEAVFHHDTALLDDQGKDHLSYTGGGAAHGLQADGSCTFPAAESTARISFSPRQEDHPCDDDEAAAAAVANGKDQGESKDILTVSVAADVPTAPDEYHRQNIPVDVTPENVSVQGNFREAKRQRRPRRPRRPWRRRGGGRHSRREAAREQPRAGRHEEGAAAGGRRRRRTAATAAARRGGGQRGQQLPVRRVDADERVDVQELGGVARLRGDQGRLLGPLLVVVAPELGQVGVLHPVPQVRRGHGLLPPRRRTEAHRDRVVPVDQVPAAVHVAADHAQAVDGADAAADRFTRPVPGAGAGVRGPDLPHLGGPELELHQLPAPQRRRRRRDDDDAGGPVLPGARRAGVPAVPGAAVPLHRERALRAGAPARDIRQDEELLPEAAPSPRVQRGGGREGRPDIGGAVPAHTGGVDPDVHGVPPRRQEEPLPDVQGDGPAADERRRPSHRHHAQESQQAQEEQAEGLDAAAAVPEAEQGAGRRGGAGAAGPDRPQGGGQGAAHAGDHRPAAALVRGEDEPGQGGRAPGEAAEGPVPSLLPCTLITNLHGWISLPTILTVNY